jgi:hypothetical protein
MTDDEWLRSSAEASPRFAARVYEKFRQGMSMKELAEVADVALEKFRDAVSGDDAVCLTAYKEGAL